LELIDEKDLYALLTACGVTGLPLMILRLPADSGSVDSPKSVSTNLLLPGYLGFIAAGGRMDDISFLVLTQSTSFSTLS
jgi:hypothetical protein